MITVDVVGLRDAVGRFASMANGGLREIALERAGVIAHECENTFRNEAPKSGEIGKEHPDGGTDRFADSITGDAVETQTGFEISIATSQPLLAQWIREGTAAHWIPKDGVAGPKALMFEWEGETIWRRVVWHPGTTANLWEERAMDILDPFIEEECSLIGQRVGEMLGNL